MSRFVLTYVCAFSALSACSVKEESAGDGDTTTGTSGITVSASSSPTGSPETAGSADEVTSAGSASQGTDGPETTAADGPTTTDASGTTGSTGTDTGDPIGCGDNVWQCGDGLDNDGDGHVDLQDPECTGPCDDDEGSFQTGIPGDNVDCKQDCFFDGNSGQGDDGCIWDVACDPANPGANIGCEFGSHGNCNSDPPNQTEDCIMFCEQYVPPGCDCFGCCTVCPDDGECVDIFLNSGPDCALDNLAACEMCTSQIEDCGNPCVPEDCEICFGETEPPEGCGENECTSDLPCDVGSDCPVDFFCYLGCCYPPPPG